MTSGLYEQRRRGVCHSVGRGRRGSPLIKHTAAPRRTAPSLLLFRSRSRGKGGPRPNQCVRALFYIQGRREPWREVARKYIFTSSGSFPGQRPVGTLAWQQHLEKTLFAPDNDNLQARACTALTLSSHRRLLFGCVTSDRLTVVRVVTTHPYHQSAKSASEVGGVKKAQSHPLPPLPSTSLPELRSIPLSLSPSLILFARPPTHSPA